MRTENIWKGRLQVLCFGFMLQLFVYKITFWLITHLLYLILVLVLASCIKNLSGAELMLHSVTGIINRVVNMGRRVLLDADEAFKPQRQQ